MLEFKSNYIFIDKEGKIWYNDWQNKGKSKKVKVKGKSEVLNVEREMWNVGCLMPIEYLRITNNH